MVGPAIFLIYIVVNFIGIVIVRVSVEIVSARSIKKDFIINLCSSRINTRWFGSVAYIPVVLENYRVLYREPIQSLEALLRTFRTRSS